MNKHFYIYILLVIFSLNACFSEQAETAQQSTSNKSPMTVTKDKTKEAIPQAPKPSKRILKSFPKTFDNRVKNVPTATQKGIFKEPQKHINELVNYLSGQADDNLNKVKLFHDWIAQNIAYDTHSYFKNKIPDQSYEAVLKRGNSVCQGNANLLKKMCDLADIDSEIILGYSRGYGHALFEKEKVKESNHAWNAVKDENGEWHLLDATWDAGYIKDRKFVKEYSTNYLFIPPEQMLYTHFPEDPKWQIIPAKLDATQISNLPKLNGYFFGFDLKLLSPLQRINEVNQTFTFKVKTPKEVFLNVQIFEKSGKHAPNATFIQKEDGISTVHMAFPKKGKWFCSIFARRLGDENYIESAEIGFINSTKNTARFPTRFKAFEEFNCILYAPLQTPLSTKKPTLFKIKAPDVAKLTLVVNEESLELKKEKNDIFVLETKLSSTKNIKLYAAEKAGDDDFVGVLGF